MDSDDDSSDEEILRDKEDDDDDKNSEVGALSGPENIFAKYMTCGESAGNGSVGETATTSTALTTTTKKKRAMDTVMECDDNEQTRPKRKPKNALTNTGREMCWLCTFCTHSKARQMAYFIAEQAPHMSNIHIAEQVKDEIMSEYPHAQGARKRDIIRHIQYHMLDPNVRLSTILRSLLSLAESVRLTMQVKDEDNAVTMDVKQVDLYLRIISQVQNTYKTGNAKMLFSLADSLGISGETKAIGN